MPTYVSLAQQGFYQPYEELGRSLARYRDRTEHTRERQQDVDFRNVRRTDELTQQGKENTRADRASELAGKLGLMNLDAGGLELDAAKRKYGQQKALENFDINSLNVTPPANIPPMIARPAASVNPKVLFGQQDPTIQKNLTDWAHINKVPLDQAIQLFQRQQTATTGYAPAPVIPPGMRITKYLLNDKGPEFEARPDFGGGANGSPQAPIGHQWVTNPVTGDMTLVKKEMLNNDESQRLQSLDTLDAAVNRAQTASKSLPAGSWIPYLGPVLSHLPSATDKGSTFWGTLLKGRPEVQSYENSAAALPMDYWRGVMGANTRLPEEEAKHLREKIAPSVKDSPEQRALKFKLLHQQIDEARSNAIQTYGKNSKDVSGFSGESPSGAPAASIESSPQAQQVRAAFRAGKLTEEQARAQLKALGF